MLFSAFEGGRKMLRIDGLSKSFGNNQVLQGIDLTVDQGETVVIIGESGCGKSVFLRCIELLEKPDQGRIWIDGDEITARRADVNVIRRKVGMVYQQFNLFSHLNVMDNLCLAPVNLLGMNRAEARTKAQELLREVGMSGREGKLPSELSGGQCQRVAIARCLMMEPKLLLMDEPTSALDPGMVSEVLATIRGLAKKQTTMLIVTHEMSFARDVANRMLFFANKGICESGTPEQILDHPRQELTKQFVRRIRSCYYHVDSPDFDLMELQGSIQMFCDRYGISKLETWRLQLSMEELLQEIITKCRQSVSIDLLVEFDAVSNVLNVHCKWSGPDWNPLVEETDSLGVTILQHIVNNAQYTHTGDMSELIFTIRKGR